MSSTRQNYFRVKLNLKYNIKEIRDAFQKKIAEKETLVCKGGREVKKERKKDVICPLLPEGGKGLSK